MVRGGPSYLYHNTLLIAPMAKSHLPAEVADFLTSRVDSIEELYILAVLSSGSARGWNVAEIDTVIRSNPDSLKHRLESLIKHGFVTHDAESDLYRYQPLSTDRANLAERLLETYAAHSVEVIERIYSKGHKNIVDFVRASKTKLKGGGSDS